MINDRNSVTFQTSDEIMLSALRPWELAKLQELTRKVIFRLSRMHASGLFPEHTYESIWGEYSHHIQNGPFEGFSNLFEDLVDDVSEDIANELPEHEKHLFDEIATASGEPGDNPGLGYLYAQLKEAVSSRASARDLNRYADDYRWYENL
ncbi:MULTISPECIES: hypothetical protein [unclassified Yoonia]|uniref:hypothetical protein n=1 Tax=unclassified Yoonia TaxID=2629118 RepID=UPI002AFDE0D6|nr:MULTISPECIES: hypothetical protein [unclassified Yoonia]